jgi:6-phosphogluconolactonase
MHHMRVASSLAVLTVAVAWAAASSAQSPAKPPASGELLVYLGTYTGEKTNSKGIYVSRLDLASGKLTEPELAAETTNPSFLAVHPTGRFLYAANEVREFEGKEGGSVSGFAVDRKTGKLTPLNQQSSVGRGPAHLTVDKSGRDVLVANYGGGSVAVLPIGTDGMLKPHTAFMQHTGASVNPTRQKGPHAHSINVSPNNRFAYAADLGLDKVLIYRFDAEKGTLAANEPPFATVKPGSGPRHFAFHPDGRFAYVINEISVSLTAFRADPERGSLTEIQTVTTLPEGETVQTGYSTAEVQVHPSGRFLYGSNRGHNSITVFTIDKNSGQVTFVQNEPTQGRDPRGFGIDPSGRYLLAGNQRSDSVIVYRIDQQTGRLTPTGQLLTLASPVCVKFVSPDAR